MSKSISNATRLYRLIFAKRERGVCRICGCTWDNPCYNPDFGCCWWWDAEETICSHCADKAIFRDPRTDHCVNDNRNSF